ncbi:putative RNA polymerase ECF-type sigma factor [Lunatimonas lonarensis]|uniref:Putative RNA polymerase ECF-type sigma factor n=2 Tax=Lunatimonas lonarensis TaxID=1232681 RepID=R7ZS19_9BACT|nr:putative RNA polymerase ECF-type sigma factor [Lunatimonas lonarensis]
MKRDAYKMNLPDSKELLDVIHLCLKGNRKAEERLFKMVYPLAISIVRRYTQSLTEAQSVVNEGMLKVFTQLANYAPEWSFGGWVRRILVHSAIDHIRRTKRFEDRHEDYSEIEPTSTFDEGVLDRISAEEILALVQKLSPAYRSVFLLYAVEGYNHREIAEELGISEGTSKSNYAKAKIKMQQAMAKINTIRRQQHG